LLLVALVVRSIFWPTGRPRSGWRSADATWVLSTSGRDRAHRELIQGAEGWPAFIELAAGGSEIRSRRYLEEEALRAIAPDRRRALAAFALVGGGDDVAVSSAPLHDLWAAIRPPSPTPWIER